MITRKRAWDLLKQEADRLQSLSYEELEIYAATNCMSNDWQSREMMVDGDRIYVNVLMWRLGHLCKRISVEMSLSADRDGILPPIDIFLYFERYKSGRMYPATEVTGKKNVLFKVLRYVFFATAILAIIMLHVWYFLL